MILSDIKKMWDKDSAIDMSKFQSCILSIPELHNKYYKLYMEEIAELKEIERQIDKVKLFLREYYLNLVPVDRLRKLNLKPNYKKLTKIDIPYYINANKKNIEINEKYFNQEIKVDYLRDILKMIHKRHTMMHTIVEFLKFSQGED